MVPQESEGRGASIVFRRGQTRRITVAVRRPFVFGAIPSAFSRDKARLGRCLKPAHVLTVRSRTVEWLASTREPRGPASQKDVCEKVDIVHCVGTYSFVRAIEAASERETVASSVGRMAGFQSCNIVQPGDLLWLSCFAGAVMLTLELAQKV